MGESATRELNKERDLYKEIERRSYSLMEASEQFSQKHRPISTSQAHGLANAINSEEKNINTVLIAYVQHQGKKSTTQNALFWTKLKGELDGLRTQAQEIQQKLGAEALTSKAAKEHLALIHLLLARDFIQHLVAHNEYQRATTGGK